MAQPQRIARAGPSKPDAKKPSPAVVDLATAELANLASHDCVVLA
jgi:hypothetical protein